jgi:uncharacterized protein YndB with AHSA1/START domain
MVWLMGIIAVLGSVVLLLTLWGRRIPETHTVRAIRELPAPVADVWKVIADMPGQVRWRADMRRIDRQANHKGNAVWLETYAGNQEILTELVEVEAPRRLVKEYREIKGPSYGRWIIQLEARGGHTQLELITHVTNTNPIARLFLRRFIGEGTLVKTYLNQLFQHLT